MTTRKFLLDIIIEDVQFHACLKSLASPVWLVVKADGVRQQIAGPFLWANGVAQLNMGSRLVLDLESLDGHYFRTSLCTFTPDRGKVLILAGAQIPLVGLPNRSHSFTYPLLKASDFTTQAAIISAKSMLQELDFEALEPPEPHAEVRPPPQRPSRTARPKRRRPRQEPGASWEENPAVPEGFDVNRSSPESLCK
jgi:hypothetical protein